MIWFPWEKIKICFICYLNETIQEGNSMKQIQKEKIITADGSPTLYMKSLDEYYHSKHGALQEANHVYIKNGFEYWKASHQNATKCTVFEMGFGTGLNAVLTFQAAQKSSLTLQYNCIEAYPLTQQELSEVDLSSYYPLEAQKIHEQIHALPWDCTEKFSDQIHFKKHKIRAQEFTPEDMYDVVYYDAFGARAQPEMWEDNCFTPLVRSMNLGGVFVTYSAKGSVRRTLQKLGLAVELIQGPPGKREMIRGVRTHL